MKYDSNLYESITSDVKLGSEIHIDDRDDLFFVSERNHVFCYTGIQFKNGRNVSISCIPSPEYIYSEIDNISNFITIENGCLLFNTFINVGYYKEQLFKQINCILNLPSSISSYYSVENYIDENNGRKYEKNSEMTIEVFGLCYEELDALLNAYSKVVGSFSQYDRYPRITRSIKKDNFCNLTGLWIPKKFPYITFNAGNCDFSHVSLWGFYRYIGLLSCHDIKSVFCKALLNNGADNKVLLKIVNMHDYSSYNKIMYRDIYKD